MDRGEASCVEGESMKLYNAPRNCRIMTKYGDEYNFHHIDGAYSYCTDDEGNVVHLSASEEVLLIDPKKEKKND